MTSSTLAEKHQSLETKVMNMEVEVFALEDKYKHQVRKKFFGPQVYLMGNHGNPPCPSVSPWSIFHLSICQRPLIIFVLCFRQLKKVARSEWVLSKHPLIRPWSVCLLVRLSLNIWFIAFFNFLHEVRAA